VVSSISSDDLVTLVSRSRLSFIFERYVDEDLLAIRIEMVELAKPSSRGSLAFATPADIENTLICKQNQRRRTNLVLPTSSQARLGPRAGTRPSAHNKSRDMLTPNVPAN
jgi:hypothetical protein